MMSDDVKCRIPSKMNETKPARKRSVMWQFFDRIDSFYAACNICGGKVAFRSTTSNLKRHMMLKHPNVNLTAIELEISATDDDPREGLKEFITLDHTDPVEEEGGSDEGLRDGDSEWTPPKKMLRKSATTALTKKIKPELISSNGVDYLIYTHDQAQQRTPATQVLTKVQALPQRPPLTTPSAPKTAPTPEEDEFSCFARFLSKRIRALKDPYWQSCAINEINSALHKVEMRRYEPPRVIPPGSDFSVQTDPLADHVVSHVPSHVAHHVEQRIVEEIVDDVVV